MRIPQFLTNYNIYSSGEKLLGIGSDLTLPNFENTADTISGAGLLGEFETPVMGSFKSQTIEINFRVFDETMFKLASQTGTASLTLRGSQQINDYSNGGIINQAVRIECRGGIKGLDLGKASPGKTTDSKITMEVLFIAIYLDDKEVLYLDKLNYIYRLAGEDMLGGITDNL